MERPLLYSLRATLVLLFALTALTSSGQTAGGRVVSDAVLVTVPNSVAPIARPEFDSGLVAGNLPMERVVLVLKVRPGAELQQGDFIAQLHDPASPTYHRWITPDEYGRRFGLSDVDLNAVLNWLRGHGFSIDEVAKGRGWINFSGTATQIERAFHTEIHRYDVGRKTYYANATPVSFPAGLADIVVGPLALHNFPKQPMHSMPQTVGPEFTSGTAHYLAPADFATIYNLNPLYNATTPINGSGQTIAIVGRTDINLADVQTFRSFFGLPANNPVFIHNGTDPGNLGGGEEIEADLDVQWSGAVAPAATVKFVISASTATTDGVDLSAQYIVNNNVAPVMSTSFGACEQVVGSSNAFYNNLWAQAATQGITSFVSSGDSGAAGCDAGSSTTGTVQGVNGLGSTPYNVAVGGTEFMDTSNPGLYWGSTNNTITQGSALSYIPEEAWNESGTVAGGSGLWSTGGGVSTLYAKPAWQVAPGVTADGKRDVPDVSLSAAGHDGYLIVQGGGLYAVGGTSASSPSFAGLMALVNQKTASRQGNANTVFYPMAQSQYGGSGPKVFHDTTVLNNTVPGVTGFNATTGYDRATGLGSVDANALVLNWGSPNPDFGISASPNQVSVNQGSSGQSTITTTAIGTFNAAIGLSASGAPAGVTVSFSPTSIAAPGSGTSQMTIAVAGTTVAGTYTLTVTGTSGSATHTTSVTLTVTVPPPPDFTISASPNAVTVAQGSSGGSTITTAVVGSFNNSVSLSASGAPAGVTVSFATNPIAAPGSGSSQMTIAVSSTTATGTYTVTVTGTGGTTTHSTSVTLTVVAPADFTISASPASVSTGPNTAAMYTITTTAVGSFNSSITLTATGFPSTVKLTFAPDPISAPGTGSSTMYLTVGATATPATYQVTVTGSGGGVTHSTMVTLTITGSTSIWTKGFDFRSSSSYVTDPANDTYVLNSTAYPVSRNGVTFGWANTTNVHGRNRSTTVDHRLAGENYVVNNVTPVSFYVDLPASGTYDLTLAMGDALYSECYYGCKIQFLDGSTVLATLSTSTKVSAGYFYDANLKAWSAAAWPANNTTLRVTLSGTRLTMSVGANNGKTNVTPVAHLAVTQVP